MDRPATLQITAVEAPQAGLHQELNSSQLAVKAGHMERWQTLEVKHKVMHAVMFLTGTLTLSYFLHLCVPCFDKR